MQSEQMRDLTVEALVDGKGQDIEALDVRGMTDITDFMIVVTGTSNRHVKALADRLLEALRAHALRPLGVEGLEDGEWVLIDFADVVVHVMHQKAREFYDLESLWNSDLRDAVVAQREGRGD